jgi:hypothetical protein
MCHVSLLICEVQSASNHASSAVQIVGSRLTSKEDNTQHLQLDAGANVN